MRRKKIKEVRKVRVEKKGSVTSPEVILETFKVLLQGVEEDSTKKKSLFL